ncbi:hypothetical protein SK803_22365 [Lentzea sp. BCCO 10_0856]|uniref:Restriction endonuclease n=1 Tax=Lentzea miocenica TaxID=3095431 RepID=A0ABU4T479_9PSEU|nr:hypothetical protein [Lentzea sp. BCCO 10_0856]MDX8032972.1 hypothetical protein [Lentzea sp. BCCO 10_0856]
MKVFDEIVRHDASEQGNSESFAVFLNRVKGEYWDQVRVVIERWLLRFPAGDRKDIRSRIRDKNTDRNVHAALWELYLHEMLLGLGYEVECHPSVAGTSRKPDFLAVGNGHSFYVEACRVFDRDAGTPVRNVKGVVLDAINNLGVSEIFLAVNIERAGSGAPPIRAMKRDILTWVTGLDVDEINAYKIGGNDRRGSPSMVWRRDDWVVYIHALPRSQKSRERASGGTLGVIMEGFRISDDVRPILVALKGKGSAYGKFDRPYLVAVGTDSWSYSEEDMEHALYGAMHEAGEFDENKVWRSWEVRGEDGFWGGPLNPRYTGVVGVLAVHACHPWNWADRTPTYWGNPFAVGSIPVPNCWRNVSFLNGAVALNEATEPARLSLGLPSPWPLGEPFAR